MRRFSANKERPRNRRLPKDATTGVIAYMRALLTRLSQPGALLRFMPRRLRGGITWSMNQRTALRTTIGALVAGWAVITCVGFVHAWSQEGSYSDRAKELAHLQLQLDEARTRTVLLESQLSTIDSRPEVRMSVIRQELGMVRANERIVRFHGSK